MGWAHRVCESPEQSILSKVLKAVVRHHLVRAPAGEQIGERASVTDPNLPPAAMPVEQPGPKV